MSKKDEAKHRARYTLEVKLEAVRLVKSGQDASVTAQARPKARQAPRPTQADAEQVICIHVATLAFVQGVGAQAQAQGLQHHVARRGRLLSRQARRPRLFNVDAHAQA